VDINLAFPTTILGASAVGLVFCAASGELELEWLGLVWVLVVTITAMFVFVHWLGFRLVDTTAANRIRSDELQFSVKQLMALMAAVAVIAAVARLLTPLVATMSALVFGLAIAICLGTLALVAAWATLRSEATRIRLSTLVAASIVIAGLVYYGMETTDADPGLAWGSVVIVYTFALAASLLVARSHGFRLLIGPECRLPTAHHATEPRDAAEREQAC